MKRVNALLITGESISGSKTVPELNGIKTIFMAAVMLSMVFVGAASAGTISMPWGTVSVGAQEVAASHGDLPFAYPDGTMGIVKLPGGGYSFTAASSGGKVRRCAGPGLDTPIAWGCEGTVEIQNSKANLDYAGGGPLYRDPATGTLLLFYHTERWASPTGVTQFYSTIAMAKSIDGGTTWTDLGEIISPNAPATAVWAAGWNHDIGGGDYLIIDGYFYVYFTDHLMSGTSLGQYITLAVARAPVASVVAAALNETATVTWQKFYNGAWTEPGLGGRSSLITTDVFTGWWAVSYNSYLKRYVMIAQGLSNTVLMATDLFWLESADGLSWENRRTLVDDATEKIYVSVAGTGEDPRVTGQAFSLYYVTSSQGANGGDRWADAYLVRHVITLVDATTTVTKGPRQPKKHPR